MRQPGFQHEALIYDDVEAFLDGTVPFVRAGLESGDPVLVAVGRQQTELLREELGADAEEVRFAEMESLGRNPARIIPFWREFVDEHGGRTVRGIGEPVWPGRGSAEIDECQRHESLLNLAFAPPPAWSLLCPYDGASLDDEVLQRVSAPHRRVARAGAVEESDEHLAGFDCFSGELTGAPLGADVFPFSVSELAQVRQRVARAAEREGLLSADVGDLLIAASELAANSVSHGGGTGTLRLWQQNGSLIAEVEDRGRMEEPLVGRLRPGITQEGGRGLWLANQLCDLVQIRSSKDGTKVRLHFRL